ncbi:MAG: DUF4326 domain-containing protein [Roseofilum sp. SID3]|uniref:DUF4326 domain-containing protein n=1 Tax=Roseofilum sp. SID3 TaxID=2821499 RepID=UPI001B296B5D|nr:DUF4326 domain-containing protein [Roseofilum sp. SID3]
MIIITNGKQTGFIGDNKIYVGRQNRYYNLSQSPLANPYKVGRDRQRMEAIEKYRKWLWTQIKSGNHVIIAELKTIAWRSLTEDIELVCWCYPDPCHAEVVRNCVNWILREMENEFVKFN